MRYGKLFNRKEYIERGLAALRLICYDVLSGKRPHKEQWEERWKFFGKEIMIHDGELWSWWRDGKKGEGIGEFTIYELGYGAAAEAYNRY